MYGHRLTFKNFAIFVRLEDGGFSQHVIRETSRRIACGRALSLAKGGPQAKVVFCKAEDELTNEEKGQWDMPSYQAPASRPVDYATLDLY